MNRKTKRRRRAKQVYVIDVKEGDMRMLSCLINRRGGGQRKSRHFIERGRKAASQ